MRSLLSFLCHAILLFVTIPSNSFPQPTADDSLKVTVVDVGAGIPLTATSHNNSLQSTAKSNS